MLFSRLRKIFGGFCLVVAVLMVRGALKQTSRNQEYEARLKPALDFVSAFQKAKHRLPSQQEFAARPSAKTDLMIDLVTKSSGDPAFSREGGRAASDFCVRIWRGEQWTYYFSWKKSFAVVEP